MIHHEQTVQCFGEVLIDRFSSSEGVIDEFGGAPANTAIGLAKLHVPVAFIGQVGNDKYGAFLRKTLKDNGVNTDQCLVSHTEPTTMAFVTLGPKGERDFTFQEGAHTAIRPFSVTLPTHTELFHFGSLLQITEPASITTERLLTQAEKQDCIISYDPNVREFLWKDLARAREVILDTVKRVHILKVNEDEARLLTGSQSPEEAAALLFGSKIEIVMITMGGEGCYFKTAKLEGMIPAIKVHVVDTTGAGDAFNAGFLYGVYKAKKRVNELSLPELTTVLRRATIIGSLTTTKKGATTAFPTQNEITGAMRRTGTMQKMRYIGYTSKVE
jgi:fructokinase